MARTYPRSHPTAWRGTGLNEGLNEGLNALVALIRNNPGKRIPWLAKCTNTPEKTIERWIADLKSQGKLVYSGSKKTGGYHYQGIDA